MKLRLLPFLLLFLAPAALQAQDIVTGHVTLPSGAAPANVKICFTLGNFSPNTPKVINTGTLVAVKNFCISPAADGSYSTPLMGNDVITPISTNWRVDFLVNGLQQSSATYYVNHTPFNLDTEVPLSVTTPAGPNQMVTQAFRFTQLTPATTWTITQNYNDSDTIVSSADANGQLIFPDTTNCRTNPNVCTLTFVSATSGFAIAMHAGAINIATNQPNAVVQNPLGAQTVNTQPLTFQGPLTSLSSINCTVINLVACVSPTNPQSWAGADVGAWINSAIAAQPANGCHIQIANGSYSFVTQVVVSGKPCKIEGAGASIAQAGGSSSICPTTLTWTGGATPAIDIGPFSGSADLTARGTVLQNFCLDNTGTGTVGIRINTVGEPKVLGVTIYPFTPSSVAFSQWGILVGDITTGGGQVNDILIRDTYVRGQANGVFLGQVSEATIDHSRILQNAGHQIQLGDATHIANDITIRDTNFSNIPNSGTGDATGAGVKIIRAANRVNLEDDYCEQQGAGALCVDASAITGNNLDALNIFHSLFTWASQGNKSNFAVSVNQSTANVNVNGNTFFNYNTAGVHGTSFAQGIDEINVLLSTPLVFDTTTNVASLYGSTSTFRALAANTVAIGGGTSLTTSNQTGTGNLVLATAPTISGLTVNGAGLTVAAGGLAVNSGTTSIGGGSAISKVLLVNGTALNSAFTSISAQTCQEQALTLTGAATTGVAAVNPTTNLGSTNLSWSARVSGADTVTVRVCNPTVGAITPNSVTWNASVLQ